MTTAALGLDRNQMKYLFMASYFRLTSFARFPESIKPFLTNYVNNNFAMIQDETLFKFLDYLQEINLKHVLLDKNIDNFRHVKPQFRFECTNKHLDVLMLDSLYVKERVPVYATNFFVSSPKDVYLIMYRELKKVHNEQIKAGIDMNYAVVNAESGFVFDKSYVDWCGLKMCASPVTSNQMYRLYLIGEKMANHFVMQNVDLSMIDNDVYSIKNYHKGTLLDESNLKIINSKNFNTLKPNDVFDAIGDELNNNSTYVKFIQRDYIYDADYPDDLLELMSEYMSPHSIYKIVNKFINGDELGNDNSEIVIDRYGVKNYRKMAVHIDYMTIFPPLKSDSARHIFIRSDLVQFRGTHNAFYYPTSKAVGILSMDSFFGAKHLATFDLDKYVFYQANPVYANEKIYSISKDIFLKESRFTNSIPIHLIVRGNFKTSLNLDDLNNSWVKNTLLKLLLKNVDTDEETLHHENKSDTLIEQNGRFKNWRQWWNR